MLAIFLYQNVNFAHRLTHKLYTMTQISKEKKKKVKHILVLQVDTLEWYIAFREKYAKM